MTATINRDSEPLITIGDKKVSLPNKSRHKRPLSLLQFCKRCDSALVGKSKARRFCWKCRGRLMERAGGLYMRAMCAFVGPEIGGVIKAWLDRRLNETVAQFNAVALEASISTMEEVVIDERAYVRGKVEQTRRAYKELTQLRSAIANDAPEVQRVLGLMLISETIMVRRLWRRYLRSWIGKSISPRKLALVRSAKLNYHLSNTSIIGALATLRKERRRGKSIEACLGESAIALLEVRQSLADEYPLEEISSRNQRRRRRALLDLSSLLIFYAPIRANRRLRRGLESMAKSKYSPQDLLIELVPNLLEKTLDERQPGEELIGWRNSLRNRVLRKLEEKSPKETFLSSEVLQQLGDIQFSSMIQPANEDAFAMREEALAGKKLLDQAGLSTRQRLVLDLYMCGLKPKEIARVSGFKSVNTVKTHRLRALKKLKQTAEKAHRL